MRPCRLVLHNKLIVDNNIIRYALHRQSLDLRSLVRWSCDTFYRIGRSVAHTTVYFVKLKTKKALQALVYSTMQFLMNPRPPPPPKNKMTFLDPFSILKGFVRAYSWFEWESLLVNCLTFLLDLPPVSLKTECTNLSVFRTAKLNEKKKWYSTEVLNKFFLLLFLIKKQKQKNCFAKREYYL